MKEIIIIPRSRQQEIIIAENKNLTLIKKTEIHDINDDKGIKEIIHLEKNSEEKAMKMRCGLKNHFMLKNEHNSQ